MLHNTTQHNTTQSHSPKQILTEPQRIQAKVHREQPVDDIQHPHLLTPIHTVLPPTRTFPCTPFTIPQLLPIVERLAKTLLQERDRPLQPGPIVPSAGGGGGFVGLDGAAVGVAAGGVECRDEDVSWGGGEYVVEG